MKNIVCKIAGADPKSGLMKALICNGAADFGNIGPDYTYGFGVMNLLRSVDMLSNNHYYISTIIMVEITLIQLLFLQIQHN
jgi:hypothetical protein